MYGCTLRFHYIHYRYNTAFTEPFILGLHGWISGVCWINRRGSKSNTAIITCALRCKRHFLRKTRRNLKKSKLNSILAAKKIRFYLFFPMETFIPSLFLKNKLRQSLQCITKIISHSLVLTNQCRRRKDASIGKSSFLCYDEVLISNRW